MLSPLNSVSGSEKNRFRVPLPLHMHATVFATGQWLC